MRRLVRKSTLQYIIINLHTKYDNSNLRGFTEIFDEKLHESKCGKKKIGQIHRRKKMRRLIHSPMIQYIIINMHTKYDYSSLYSFTDIFDTKFLYSKNGNKSNKYWTNAGKNKHEKVCSQYHNKKTIINLHSKYDYSS